MRDGPGTQRIPGSVACPEWSPSESRPGSTTTAAVSSRFGREQQSSEECSFPEGQLGTSLT